MKPCERPAWLRFLLDESGQDVIEYLLVVSLLVLGAVVSLKALATTIGTSLTGIGAKLTTYTS
jgi:Flp pilus assembly pilin Flp